MSDHDSILDKIAKGVEAGFNGVASVLEGIHDTVNPPSPTPEQKMVSLKEREVRALEQIARKK